MKTVRIFTNGNSQAVRLPKEFRFDDDEVVVIRNVGDAVLLLPRQYDGNALKALLDVIGPMDLERQQPMPGPERNFG